MTDAIAIPRQRVKRRKPMPPYLKWCIAMVLMDAAFLFYNVFKIASGNADTYELVMAGVWSALLAFNWPRMKREWNAWKRDDP